MSYPTGWIPFEQRDLLMQAAHAEALARMPSHFALSSSGDDKGDQVLLTDFWKHPEVVASVGYEFPGIHQLTGSCVGAGGGNVVFTLAAVEVVRLGDPEQALVPFWLYTYGRSRFRAGMRGRGEGSMGSSFAEAIREDGIVPATDPGLPPFNQREGLVWGESAELQWSDGESADANVVARAKRFVVKSTAPCRDHTQVRAAIQNYFPCTNACSYYASPNGARVQDGVCLGRLDSRGGHQTGFLGWKKHPTLGDLYLYANQWGFVYPQCPTGAPRIACWLLANEVDRICSEGEVYAFSQFQGFPGQPKLLSHYI